VATRGTVKASLESWIALLSASTVGAGDGLMVRWRGESVASEGWREAAWAECYLSQPSTNGRDVRIYEHDATGAAGEELRHYQMGQRQLTLDLQVRSHRGSGAYDAGEYTRRIRDRMLLDDGRALLAAAGVSIATVADDRDITELSDQTEFTVAQLDIRLNSSALEEGAPTTFIETAEVETEFRLADGSLASEQFSGDIEVD